MIGKTREEINIPGTNIMNWKQAKFLLNDDFFSKLAAYEHAGPKEDKPPKYATIDRILKRLEKYNEEDIFDYNVGVGVLYKYIRQCCEARLADIARRKEDKENQR
mmetsp:Transcript_35437/g.31933  ORF Transcript_35437/g.31933 Transcript_35437/m.31933 type:complete len:105 (-) Transcript_35437:345-659(-)